jgi:ribosome maturation protein Sdo1
MTLEQLTYTPSDKMVSSERRNTMVLIVEGESYRKYQQDKTIPLAQVVDSFEVYQFEEGKSGRMGKPSQQELQATFGTTNEDDIVQFMCEHGTLHGKPI